MFGGVVVDPEQLQQGIAGRHAVVPGILQELGHEPAGLPETAAVTDGQICRFYYTADLTAMAPTSKSVMILLMLMRGSPGSTAAGMKTTTFAVLIFKYGCHVLPERGH